MPDPTLQARRMAVRMAGQMLERLVRYQPSHRLEQALRSVQAEYKAMTEEFDA